MSSNQCSIGKPIFLPFIFIKAAYNFSLPVSDLCLLQFHGNELVHLYRIGHLSALDSNEKHAVVLTFRS